MLPFTVSHNEPFTVKHILFMKYPGNISDAFYKEKNIDTFHFILKHYACNLNKGSDTFVVAWRNRRWDEACYDFYVFLYLHNDYCCFI